MTAHPPPPALHLEHLATAEITMASPLVVGAGPNGTRVVVDLVDGRFEGRLSGRLTGRAGADWIVVGPDGTGILDVRLVIATDDGSLVHVESRGRIDLRPGHEGTPAVLATTFETAAPALADLNRLVAVTRADSAGNRLLYTISAVVPD
jgi:hypothetical protein